MFDFIYTSPFARHRESWNRPAIIPSPSVDAYCDPLIKGKSNDVNETNSFYKNIAIDLVSETCYHYPGPYLSEKTLRPILHKRMFILVAPPGTLSLLKQTGYQTFSPFINEEYDEIHDPWDRMIAIVDEVERLCNIPIDQIKQAMYQHQEILEHNYNHLITQPQRDADTVARLLTKASI